MRQLLFKLGLLVVRLVIKLWLYLIVLVTLMVSRLFEVVGFYTIEVRIDLLLNFLDYRSRLVDSRWHVEVSVPWVERWCRTQSKWFCLVQLLHNFYGVG